MTSEQHNRYIQDQKEFGDLQEGTHRGFTWKAKRHPFMKHWCGYFDSSLIITPSQKNQVNLIAHGGLTAHHGFDCAHLDDYIPGDKELAEQMPGFPFGNRESTYKDFPFVKKVLCYIINYLLKPKMKALTGGDSISARDLYDSATEFKPVDTTF